MMYPPAVGVPFVASRPMTTDLVVCLRDANCVYTGSSERASGPWIAGAPACANASTCATLVATLPARTFPTCATPFARLRQAVAAAKRHGQWRPHQSAAVLFVQENECRFVRSQGRFRHGSIHVRRCDKHHLAMVRGTANPARSFHAVLERSLAGESFHLHERHAFSRIFP